LQLRARRSVDSTDAACQSSHRAKESFPSRAREDRFAVKKRGAGGIGIGYRRLGERASLPGAMLLSSGAASLISSKRNQRDRSHSLARETRCLPVPLKPRIALLGALIIDYARDSTAREAADSVSDAAIPQDFRARVSFATRRDATRRTEFDETRSTRIGADRNPFHATRDRALNYSASRGRPLN